MQRANQNLYQNHETDAESGKTCYWSRQARENLLPATIAGNQVTSAKREEMYAGQVKVGFGIAPDCLVALIG